jgi:hypothetical protein
MHLSRSFWILVVAFTLPLPFLFLAALAPGSTLWLQRVWDAGHVPLFAIWMMLAVQLLPLPRTLPFVLLRAAGLFAAAVAIEYVQLHTGRQFSTLDMYLDACGIALGARLSVPASREIPRLRRCGLDLLLAALIAIGLRDAGIYAFDRAYMEVQFPQLWSAAQPFPLLRIANPSKYVVVDNAETGNQPAMRVDFVVADYSIVEMLAFSSDWRGYSALHIDVKNPAASAFDMICRVHDAEHHAHGGVYGDRFNRVFTLQPGWNALAIPISDIESAPAKRKMQMDSIEGLSCFTKKLKQPQTAYFRAIWLGTSR